jgi:hypothetical protein
LNNSFGLSRVNIIFALSVRVIDEIDGDSGVALKVRKSEESPKLSIIDYALFTLRDAKVMGVCGIQMAPFAKRLICAKKLSPVP